MSKATEPGMADFKVMPWLRAVRARVAEQDRGLSFEERRDKAARAAARLRKQLRLKPPASPSRPQTPRAAGKASNRHG